MATIERERLSFQARDVSGQKVVSVSDVPLDSSVGEVVQGLVAKMNLPYNDVEGRPLNYHVRLEREGRHLRASETVGEVLEEEDQIVLQPHIVAG